MFKLQLKSLSLALIPCLGTRFKYWMFKAFQIGKFFLTVLIGYCWSIFLIDALARWHIYWFLKDGTSNRQLSKCSFASPFWFVPAFHRLTRKWLQRELFTKFKGFWIWCPIPGSQLTQRGHFFSMNRWSWVNLSWSASFKFSFLFFISKFLSLRMWWLLSICYGCLVGLKTE